MLAALLLSSGAAFGEAYTTAESRQELASLVASLPPVLSGVYGNPFPVNIETLGGSIAWKSGASMALIVALWSVFAMSGTLASRGPPRQPRVRRDDAARHAPDRASRRSPRTSPGWRSSSSSRPSARGSPDPRSPRSRATRSRPSRRSGSPCGSASSRWRRAASPSRWPRSSAAARPSAIAGRDHARRLLRQRLPGRGAGVRRHREPHLVGLDGAPPAARRPSSTGRRSIPVAIVAIVLFVAGVELFARRDLGMTSRDPVAVDPDAR